MDTRIHFQSLSLGDSNSTATPDLMDLDLDLDLQRDTDGDVIMDESISNSPSLPLRYHNYFHRIKRVNLTKNTSTSTSPTASLQEMRSRIQEIDDSIRALNSQQEKMKYSSASSSDNDNKKSGLRQKVEEQEGQEQEQDKGQEFDQSKEETSGKSLIRSIMSPTLLGARVAYNNSTLSPNSTPVKLAEPNSEQVIQSSTVDDGIVSVASENGTPLMQFQLHHHHYYYPTNQPTTTTTINAKENNGGDYQLQLTPEGDVMLPHASKVHDTPYYLSTYLQSVLNFLVSVYAFSIVYQLICGMKLDIELRLQEKIHDGLIEVELCRSQYEENRCFKTTVTPVIREQCAEWEKCMSKDPYSSSGKLVVTLQLLGMVLDSLIEPISLRSCFVLVVCVCCSFALNFAFGFLRLKIYYRGLI